MKMLEAHVLGVALGLVVLCDVAWAQITVTINATASHPVPSTMFGQVLQSGDGGLYAELLQDRAFQLDKLGVPTSWVATNNSVNVSVIEETAAVSRALPNALQVSLPAGELIGVGIANHGYSGINVINGTQYNASFYYRFQNSSQFNGNIEVGFQDEGGKLLAFVPINATASQTGWQHVQLTLDVVIPSNSTANVFTIKVSGISVAGEIINFAMLSLFPRTFNNRENGMRVDIAEALSESKPSFLHFPGGYDMFGQSIADRWQWNNTVGPLLNRPGRNGTNQTYADTDGLGLLEYLYFCEDLDMQPIMTVWAGYSPKDNQTVGEDELQPYINQSIDQIEFVVGNSSEKNSPAALRKALGHPDPFPLNYVQVGYRDYYDGSSATSYNYRWNEFVTALQAKFPNINFIATSNPFSPLSPNATYYEVDSDVYTPAGLIQNSFYYDDFERNGTQYFQGEYSSYSTNKASQFPTMQGSAAEAAFMTGLERNSDIVLGASYSNLLGEVASSQWIPTLLSFDAGSVYRSTSYYVQKLFSLNCGDEYLPSTLPDRQGSIFWSVVRWTSTNEIVIKVSNTDNTTNTLKFVLPFDNVDSSGSLQLLTGNATSSNTPADPNLIVPVTSSISTGQTFNYTVPPYSFSVITFTAS